MMRKGIVAALAAMLLSLSLGLKAVELVDINTASADQLSQALYGIGPAKAEEIIRHREQYGPFKSIDELVKVKGVGDALLSRNRDRIAPVVVADSQ